MSRALTLPAIGVAEPDSLVKPILDAIKQTLDVRERGDTNDRSIIRQDLIDTGLLTQQQLDAIATVASGQPVVRRVATTYTVNERDLLVLADASGGAFTIRLPSAVARLGRTVKIKKVDSSANAVTVSATASQTIDGASTKVISSQHDGFEFESDNVNWWIADARSASSALSSITAASAANTIASGNNHSQVWNWALTTDSKSAFTLGETSAATGGTSTSGVPNQVLLKLATLAASTMSPFSVSVRGNHLMSVSPTATQLLFSSSGSAANPTIGFVADVGDGFYETGANVIRMALGGTQYYVWQTGSFSVLPTTEATDTVTGALVVSGGAAVAKAGQFGGNLTAANLTAWAAFTTTRTGWTDGVGSPTVTANYCRVGQVIHFEIKVVPATTVATVAGTSYCSLPVAAGGLSGDASMMNITTLVAAGNCVIDITNSRCYVPTQAATGNTLTIAGWYRV